MVIINRGENDNAYIRDNAISKWSQFINNGEMIVYLIKEIKNIDIKGNMIVFTCDAEETHRQCWANYY